MRTLLFLIVGLGFIAKLCGQGTILFSNLGAPPEQRVYVDEWLNPSALVPGGGQFLATLYFTQIGQDESSLTQIGGPAGFLGTADERHGTFFGGSRTVPTPIPGSPGLFQVRAWEARFGGTYEEAAANPNARVGKSLVFESDTADPNALESHPSLISSGRFRGFVIAVPEPSTTILAMVGVVAAVPLLLRKHPKR